MSSPKSIILLGPQRHEPRVKQTLRRIGSTGDVALIAAGWEEREPEHAELEEHLGRRVHNLEAFRRGEEVFAEDNELFKGMQERHDQLSEVQDRYRLRLGYALAAARELFALDAGEGVAADIEAALEAVRVLDSAHLDRVTSIHSDFAARFELSKRPSIVRQSKEISRILSATETICIAGGHVGILRNRMRMFELDEVMGDHTVVAWAAGAMALTERVVLFHDSPPQGAGDAEFLERGAGLAKDIVCLPHAAKRLQLEDRMRVSLMARRLAPALCATLDPVAELESTTRGWAEVGASARLLETGTLEPVGGA